MASPNMSDSESVMETTTAFTTFENPFSKTYVRVVFITSYGVVCALCVFGNVLVLVAVARSRCLRSRTNFFLANLAVADLCVGVFCVLPNLYTYLSPTWMLGRAMCKFYYYVWNVSYIASILILTIIAVERYIAIIHPLKIRLCLTRRKLVLTQALNWLVAITYNVPYLVFYDTVQLFSIDMEFCYFKTESISGLKGLSVANLLFWYIVPLSLIAAIYSRISKALWKTTFNPGIRLKSAFALRTTSTGSPSPISPGISATTSCFEKPPQDLPDNLGRYQIGNDLHYEAGYSDDNTREQDNTKCSLVSSKMTLEDQYKPGTPTNENSDGSPSNTEMCCSDSLLRSHITEDKLGTNQHKTLPGVRWNRKSSNGRKEVVRLLAAIVFTFAICVLPHHLKVVNHYWNIFTLPHRVDVYVSPCSHLLLYLNSALDPILYALLSNNFRKGLKETFPCFRK